jgi:hypothetical protein
MHRLLVTANFVPSSPILGTLMMEALSSSETSVLTRATRRNIPEVGILHSHRHEILQSYIALTGWTLEWRRNVSPVRYELGFYIPEDGILELYEFSSYGCLCKQWYCVLLCAIGIHGFLFLVQKCCNTIIHSILLSVQQTDCKQPNIY